MVDVVRTGSTRRPGIGRLRHRRADLSTGELDIDRGLEAIASARARGDAPALDELMSREWSKPELALCLVVDRSGSMGGDRLATAAVAAAACLWRAPIDTSVIAFSDDAFVLASQGSGRAPEGVVTDLLRLRGHGTTDLALGLRTAAAQLERSRASRKVTILLSDARPTAGSDPAAIARGLDELVIVAPADDDSEAMTFAAATGARCVGVAGPSSIPDAIGYALFG
jgi:Mg-chelatase subunit ChlD